MKGKRVMEFNGKTALVTGASVGIGRATAILLAKKGASLVLLDVDFERLVTLKEELSAYTEDVLIYRCDISNEALVYETVEEATKHFGKIDILVNNAALWRDFAPFAEVSTELWRKYFDINVMGTVYVTKAVIDGMIQNGYGRIINVASVAGVYGNKNMAHYSATKGAVISFTQALAKEVATNGITVNSVSPGSVSPSSESDIDYSQPSQLSYMERTGTCRENADLICFLASEGSGYITGQNIQIDGGRKKL